MCENNLYIFLEYVAPEVILNRGHDISAGKLFVIFKITFKKSKLFITIFLKKFKT